MSSLKKSTTSVNPCGFTDEEMNALFRIKASPLFWRQKSEELKYASDLLFPYAHERDEKLMRSMSNKNIDFADHYPSVYSQAFGLLGFSLECLFKAVIIRDNPNLIDNGKLSKTISNHNLILLADTAKIKLNQDELYACERLSEIMIKDFRYPIKKVVEKERNSFKVINIPKVAGGIYERIHPEVNQIHTAKGTISYKRSSSKLDVRKVRKPIKKRAVKKKK